MRNPNTESMQVVCISRGTSAGGRGLATRLAANLGYRCLSREDLVESAIKEGIHVGKLEMAMVKPGGFTERLALEREHYLAFTTCFLCDRAMEGGGLVYHGRTGHLLLPGVSHVLRLRVVADREYRLRVAMQQLGVDREKARKYMDEVDEDRRRWVRSLYGVSWDDVAHYDFMINLEQVSVENVAAAMTSVAQLPDFQMTPASQRAMGDLRLAAKARVLLARDERTWRSGFKVSAADGIVTVTYLPQDSRVADAIPIVVGAVEGVREVRATMAGTNLMWVAETFDPSAPVFENIVEIATKWNAAVELVRLPPGDDVDVLGGSKPPQTDAPSPTVDPPRGSPYNGGVEDDDAAVVIADDGGVKETMEALARIGRSGGSRRVMGGQERLAETLDRAAKYSIVVVGDVFLSKGSAARVRLTRELRSLVADHVKAPVVLADELKAQYLFGRKDAFRAMGFLLLVVLIYLAVFHNEEQVLVFLSREGWQARTLAVVAVFLFIPLVAYLYGSVVQAALKLIKME